MSLRAQFVAALHAQFPVSPSENWAHKGYGRKAGVSSFHWGSGSGLAGIEIDAAFLRDAVVDVPAGRCVGVNGLNATACSIADGKIQLGLDSPFSWRRPAVVMFHGAAAKQRYQLYVNGAEIGAWSGAQLAQGVSVPANAISPTP